jgi:hypothetical protein
VERISDVDIKESLVVLMVNPRKCVEESVVIYAYGSLAQVIVMPL